MRLVYYSLANMSDNPREQQWMHSIRSLRQHNSRIEVCLFLFNGASAALLEEADRQRVTVHFLGDYREFLERRYVYGAVLSLLPTFHKFPVLQQLSLAAFSQILYLDCDTYLFDDVELLFEHCASSGLYAREEPNSRRSDSGGDPAHIDEDVLYAIAEAEGLPVIEPFNDGVCLMNDGAWNHLGRAFASHLDFAWRLLCGCETGLGQKANDDEKLQRAVRRSWNPLDRGRALPYPSANIWIIEEIALWLALGRERHLAIQTFPRELVAQGGEFAPMFEAGRPPLIAHYFTSGEDQFLKTVRPVPQ